MNWPHAPAHWDFGPGTYIVTGSTLHKQHLFSSDAAKDMVCDTLVRLADQFQWELLAWAVMANHYHFVAQSRTEAAGLKRVLTALQACTARDLNKMDAVPGRQVWFQFWDTRITHQTSLLARLNYVQNNPVKHGLVANPRLYPWCSAGWFESTASPAFVKTVASFKTDKVNVPDDF